MRQEAGGAPGRELRVQVEGGVGMERESVLVDAPASTATRAASSAAVGVPRTTLTSGSASIDRAYDTVVLRSADVP